MKAFKSQKENIMQRKDAEELITKFIKPIYGFALKRAKSLQDAEDLSQEIALRAFRALLMRDDIEEPEKFIWTIAHNALANHYRDMEKTMLGTPIDELSELLMSDAPSAEEDIVFHETKEKLQNEIAYLSKTQRAIVILYYYENKKQEEIASILNIPKGTVKWHLFEAKKELKRGMNIMREHSELKFNPIKFDTISTNGSQGTKGHNANFFRSALSQNIAYITKDTPKTINEIAEALGVSPVYVESEAEYLEEYAFLIKKGEKYLANIIIEEPTDELMRLHDEAYEKAASLFGNSLYDALIASDILDDRDIYGGRFGEMTMTEDPPKDKNFLLWALIPYIAANSESHAEKNHIKFEDVATYRPDGGHNICNASLLLSDVTPPKYMEDLKKCLGPCWNENEHYLIWTCDTKWSGERIDYDTYTHHVRHVFSLLAQIDEGNELPESDLAELAKHGYIRVVSGKHGDTKIAPLAVQIGSRETKEKLLNIGIKLRNQLSKELDALKAPYCQAVMKNTAPHMRKVQEFQLQYMFDSDGWFILHILHTLLANGKLKPPTEEQKRAVSTLVIHK